MRILQAHGTIIPGRKELVSFWWLGFAFAGGGRPKPELASAIHDVASLLKCIVKTGPCASPDWVSSQNLAAPAYRELVGADQEQRSIMFVKPPGVSFRRSLAAILVFKAISSPRRRHPDRQFANRQLVDGVIGLARFG